MILPGDESKPAVDRADRADREHLCAVDGTLAEAARRAGGHLVCRPGCTECCVGPFPIDALDARRLRRGLAELRSRDPDRGRAVVRRARAAVAQLSEGFPGDAGSGELAADEATEVAFLERHAGLPCPALDPSTGRCDLYAFRPVPCRTFGPPVRIGAVDLPPCHLCFRGARPAEVEACRVTIDPEGRGEAVLAMMGPLDSTTGETLIAFALR